MHPAPPRERQRMLTTALRLVTISVAFGIAAGAVSVITGLHGTAWVFSRSGSTFLPMSPGQPS